MSRQKTTLGGVMGGGQPGPADRPMPHYRPAPGYPPLPEYLPVTGHRPMAAERPAEGRLPDDLAALECLPVTSRPPAPDSTVSYRTISEYLPVADWPPAPDYPAVPHRRAGGRAGRRAAVLGYLTVPVFGVPVLIYLTTLRGPGWARRHAAQAANVWFTGLLYDLSAVIMGAMLALDSPPVALMVFAPLVAARWLVTLAHLARAARAAGRGAAYAFPAWLYMRLAR